MIICLAKRINFRLSVFCRAWAANAYARMSVLMLLAAITSGHPAIAQDSMGMPSQPDQAIGMMQDHDAIGMEEMMVTLADEMAAIRRTRDPQERRRMMEKHRENMREAMLRLREMGGESMQAMMADHLAENDEMSPPDKKRVHRHKQSPVSGGGGTKSANPSRLSDLELRVDMMQIMMESLAEQCMAP